MISCGRLVLKAWLLYGHNLIKFPLQREKCFSLVNYHGSSKTCFGRVQKLLWPIETTLSLESFAFSCFVHVSAGLSYETAGILIIYVINVKLLE